MDFVKNDQTVSRPLVPDARRKPSAIEDFKTESAKSTTTVEENDDPISEAGNITTPLPEAQMGSAATASINFCPCDFFPAAEEE